MIPSIETIKHDPKVTEKYDTLTARLRELRAELGAVNVEADEILVNLGELVASGKKYKKQTDRLAALRSESEALGAGIRHITNQCDLLQRMNTWITAR